jgi:hypothetical protein
MQRLFAGILLVWLLAACVSGCGPTYGYVDGYLAFGYAPHWGDFVRPEPYFVIHHPWEDHWYGHPGRVLSWAG